MPFSKNTKFGPSDVRELASILQEKQPSELEDRLVLPKLRAMYASRACRSSVMIGDALSHQQMGTVVQHLGTLDRPWNCPHGRPTMRHLCDLTSYPV